MIPIKAYAHLIRFDKPIGTLLLWYPTAWALWMANHGMPQLQLLVCFFLGTFFMRSAGCILNDIADRHVDGHVTRTKMRPLVSKKVSLEEAFALLFICLLAAFIILIELPKSCFNYALLSLMVTAIYPFCKRFFHAPQLVLGIAFSMGIPMAYSASDAQFNLSCAILMLLNFFWIVAYDTIYAMTDKPDDIKIGVQSTAVLLGRHDKNMVGACQIVTQLLWLLLAYIESYGLLFYTVWMIGCVLFIHQQVMIRGKAPRYLDTFSNNSFYGLTLWVALIQQYLR